MSVKTSKSFSLLTTLALAASPLIGCGGEPMVSEEGVALELEALGQGLVHNGNDYLFITTPKTWLEARNDCLRAGYDLVTINDSQEEAFLQAQEQSHGLYSWWIGFNDRSTEGQGSWAGPASSTYLNFYPGEPNDSMGNEDCTTDRYSTPDGTIRSELWNDENCNRSFAYICERNGSSGSAAYNGNDYLFITTPKTWPEARNYCLGAGYDLVTINDSEEEAFLQTQEQSRELYGWWIGLNDRNAEGQWSWASGTSSYLNWYPGEPNDYMGDEDCAADRYSTPDGTIRSELWNDESCTKPLSFICERRTPTGMSGSFSYSASNTASATANTLNQTVSLVAGQLFQVGTCGVMGASGSGDTYLRLVDPSGTEIASNDDAGGNCGLLSTLSLRVPVTGTYTVRAGCFSSGSCSGTVAYTY